MPWQIPHWIVDWHQDGSTVRCRSCGHTWTLDVPDGVVEDEPCPSCGQATLIEVVEPGPGSVTRPRFSR